jgi:DNA-binding transcriptional ArsR family regulator
MDTQAAVASLAALAQPHRLAVFRRLVELGPDGALAGDLAAYLAIPANTLSFHLKTLQQAGLIAPEPRGRHIRYRADFGAMRGLVGFLTENCCGGDAAQCAPADGPAQAAGCC